MVRATHVVQRAGDAAREVVVAGHALWAHRAGHPLREAVAQQAEVVTVELGCVRLLQRLRVDAADHRVGVVLVQARHHQRLQRQARALGDAGPGLFVAAQRARDHGVEAQPTFGPVAPQSHRLALAQLAELVIVGGAEGGLAVPHEV